LSLFDPPSYPYYDFNDVRINPVSRRNPIIERMKNCVRTFQTLFEGNEGGFGYRYSDNELTTVMPDEFDYSSWDCKGSVTLAKRREKEKAEEAKPKKKRGVRKKMNEQYRTVTENHVKVFRDWLNDQPTDPYADPYYVNPYYDN
jgi:hypothetical protein